MANLPEPTWLVDQMIGSRSLALLYGAPGVGKTFVALDIAFAVATGTEWWERSVRKGPVVYVAAEGVYGLSVRVQAVRAEFRLKKRAGVHFCSGAVQMLDSAEVASLITLARNVEPILVIVDTLARCMLGGDEDSAKDMGRFIAAADIIRNSLRTTVLLVHHSAKTKPAERGSSALRGAVDTVIQQTKIGGAITLKCEKQKDGEAFGPIDLRLKRKVLAGELESCVIAIGDDNPVVEAFPDSNGRQVIRALQHCELYQEFSGELQQKSGLTRRTFYRTLGVLVARGRIRKLRQGRRTSYELATGESNGASANQVPDR